MTYLLLGLAILTIACSEDGGDRPKHVGRRPSRESPLRRFRPARVLGRIQDPSLIEVSGIVASRRSPRSYWVHNDSDGSPSVACVRVDGTRCGSVSVSGASLIDWEDIAADGEGRLLIGDIGDNLVERRSVTVFRLPEPAPPGPGAIAPSDAVDALELTYPNGPRDAEVLLVHPETQNIYVVTKNPAGRVYRAGPNGGEMKLVGKIRLPGLFSIPTGGDISRDGEHVVIGTYGSAFEFTRPRGAGFDAIWREDPREVSLPSAQQREAIAYRLDGKAIVSTSEGLRPPIVQRVVRPAQ